MLGRAHVSAAAAAALAAAWMAGVSGTTEALAALAGGLAAARLPDLDLGRGHRVLLHNLAALAVFSLAAWLAGCQLGFCGFGLGFAAGYASHLLLDMFTVSGVALLYPFSGRRLRLARLRSDDKLANTAVEIGGYLATLYLASLLVPLGYP